MANVFGRTKPNTGWNTSVSQADGIQNVLEEVLHELKYLSSGMRMVLEHLGLAVEPEIKSECGSNKSADKVESPQALSRADDEFPEDQYEVMEEIVIREPEAYEDQELLQEQGIQEVEEVQSVHALQEVHHIQEIPEVQDIQEIQDMQEIQEIQDELEVLEVQEVQDVQGEQEEQERQEQQEEPQELEEQEELEELEQLGEQVNQEEQETQEIQEIQETLVEEQQYKTQYKLIPSVLIPSVLIPSVKEESYDIDDRLMLAITPKPVRPFALVNSLYDLAQLESKAANPAFITPVIEWIGHIDGGGRTVCLQIVDQFFDRSFLLNVSWTGSSRPKPPHFNQRDKKIALRDYINTIDLFYRTVLYSDPEFTFDQATSFLHDCLRNASQRRDFLKLRKSATKRRRRGVSNGRGEPYNRKAPRILASKSVADFDPSIYYTSEEDLSLSVETAGEAHDVEQETNMTMAKDKLEHEMIEIYPMKMFTPIKCLSELNALEKQAADKSFVVSVLRSIGRVHGRGRAVALQMVDQFFDRNFLTHCSWAGISKEGEARKIPLSMFCHTINLFYRAVLYSDLEYGLIEAKQFLQWCLSNAKSRSKKQPLKLHHITIDRPPMPFSPVASLAELDALERQASDQTFILCVIKAIGTVEGGARTACLQLVDRFFDRGFLMQASWTGTSRTKRDEPNGTPKTEKMAGKIALRNYPNTMKLFYHAIRQSDLHFGFDQAKLFLRTCLKNSKQRLECRRMRKPVAKRRVKSTGASPGSANETVNSTIAGDTDAEGELNDLDQALVEPVDDRIIRVVEFNPEQPFAPLKCLDDLEWLEAKATDQSFIVSVVKAIGCILGGGPAACLEIMDRFFDPSFLLLCSWTRMKSGEIPLGTYENTINLFHSVVRYSDLSFPLEETKAFLQRCIRITKQRSQIRGLKTIVTKRKIQRPVWRQQYRPVSRARNAMPFAPVTCLAELDELEKIANQRSIIISFINAVGSIRGGGRNACLQIVDRIFDRSFLLHCSWSGASRGSKRGKIGLKNYENILQLFYRAVLYSDPAYQYEEFERFLSFCTRNAKHRHSASLLRKSVTKRWIGRRDHWRTRYQNQEEKDDTTTDQESAAQFEQVDDEAQPVVYEIVEVIE
ncbi:uncharacterized protein LOC125951105 [Anopheles darlingi]|uniref:uncharacterized protein LOC125951105 n=1 Tax=Anopheles darlingi TaxID=43151 RepID=UPI00210066C0|nr:uncharacterized protein LOC125951105 [Anopheles darlingi]